MIAAMDGSTSLGLSAMSPFMNPSVTSGCKSISPLI
jgi:hypothetical protein